MIIELPAKGPYNSQGRRTGGLLIQPPPSGYIHTTQPGMLLAKLRYFQGGKGDGLLQFILMLFKAPIGSSS